MLVEEDLFLRVVEISWLNIFYLKRLFQQGIHSAIKPSKADLTGKKLEKLRSLRLEDNLQSDKFPPTSSPEGKHLKRTSSTRTSSTSDKFPPDKFPGKQASKKDKFPPDKFHFGQVPPGGTCPGGTCLLAGFEPLLSTMLIKQEQWFMKTSSS